ncbi:MAG TPA: hypothetical protein VFM82_11695 [Flavobacteriaceae bacterium]|nr:hypothetical protein [Flavobacteriaceae bacterium]
MQFLKKQVYFFLAILVASCAAPKKTVPESLINTELNEESRASRKTFYGKLEEEEYSQIREMIETELGTSIPEDKAILINFEQYGRNCRKLILPEENLRSLIHNIVEISNRISAEKNTADFFIYTKNVPFKKLYEENESFQLDPGFFSKNIFTLHENCSGFFILKTNGEFMKRYGGDYFTHVQNFLNGVEFKK